MSDELEKASEEYRPGGTPGAMMQMAQDDYVEAIRQAFKSGAQWGKPKWIPVSERLPDKKGPVLMLSNRLETVPTCAAAGYELWYWDEYSAQDVGLRHITHWMPLPDEPEGMG